MRVYSIDPANRYKYRTTTRTIESIVEEKINVLKDFCVIDTDNEDDVRKDFITKLKNSESKDLDYVADRIAKGYMSAAWNKG